MKYRVIFHGLSEVTYDDERETWVQFKRRMGQPEFLDRAPIIEPIKNTEYQSHGNGD